MTPHSGAILVSFRTAKKIAPLVLKSPVYSGSMAHPGSQAAGNGRKKSVSAPNLTQRELSGAYAYLSSIDMPKNPKEL